MAYILSYLVDSCHTRKLHLVKLELSGHAWDLEQLVLICYGWISSKQTLYNKLALAAMWLAQLPPLISAEATRGCISGVQSSYLQTLCDQLELLHQVCTSLGNPSTFPEQQIDHHTWLESPFLAIAFRSTVFPWLQSIDESWTHTHRPGLRSLHLLHGLHMGQPVISSRQHREKQDTIAFIQQM